MNMRKLKKLLSVSMCAMLVPALLAGCGGGTNNEASPDTSASATDKGAPPASKNPVKITIWMPLNVNAAVTVKNLNEVAATQEWSKRTNVAVEFQHPSAGTESEQLNVTLASNNLPDVFQMSLNSFPGGLQKAYSDGVIIKLNDLIDQYAPNLKKIMDENPIVAKQLKSDSGDIFALPHLRTGSYKVFAGLMIRQDWLDDLGLEAPETVDEWETVLRAFKEKKGAEIPLLAGAPPKLEMMGPTAPGIEEAFGITNNYYLDNGAIKYGPIEPGYKDFLTVFNKWYNEGLIDPDFATNDQKTFDAKVTSGKAGAFFGYIGGSMGRYLPALQETDPKAKLSAVQFPVMNKGDQPLFTGRSWEWDLNGAVITKSAKNPEEIVKAFDYLYSPEGHMLKNFGIEGQTYTMKDGQPVYTDLIMKNPDKLTVAQAMAKHFFANYPFVGVDDDRYNDQYYELPAQKEAVKLYAKYADNTLKVSIPPTSLTPEEAKEMSRINSDATTYRDEMFVKFVMGAEPLANFDAYVTQMKKFNIDRGIQIQQDALARYNAR